MLKVKLLDGAKAPVCSRPREDLGYDIFALEDIVLLNKVTHVRTGIFIEGNIGDVPCGFIIKDRSSMAAKGIFTHGGVIDAGYRGEIVVLMSNINYNQLGDYQIKSGDKIAQLIPIPVWTDDVIVQDELTETSRGDKGFGSSGT